MSARTAGRAGRRIPDGVLQAGRGAPDPSDGLPTGVMIAMKAHANHFCRGAIFPGRRRLKRGRLRADPCSRSSTIAPERPGIGPESRPGIGLCRRAREAAAQVARLCWAPTCRVSRAQQALLAGPPPDYCRSSTYASRRAEHGAALASPAALSRPTTRDGLPSLAGGRSDRQLLKPLAAGACDDGPGMIAGIFWRRKRVGVAALDMRSRTGNQAASAFKGGSLAWCCCLPEHCCIAQAQQIFDEGQQGFRSMPRLARFCFRTPTRCFPSLRSPN